MTIKWSASDVALWAEMYARPMELAEISSATGANIATIKYRLTKMGVRLRGSNGPLPNPEVRFERMFTPEPNTGCWLWLGRVDKFGYGFFRHAGENMAHRSSYRLHKQSIPVGLHVLHTCDVPGCVNPDHLFLGTQADNMADCARKGRTQRENAKKTHCPHGHPYIGDNVRSLPNGGRACRSCERIKANRYRRANIEAARAKDRERYWANKENRNA